MWPGIYFLWWQRWSVVIRTENRKQSELSFPRWLRATISSVGFDSWEIPSFDPKLHQLLPKSPSGWHPTITGPLLWGSQSLSFLGIQEVGKQDLSNYRPHWERSISEAGTPAGDMVGISGGQLEKLPGNISKLPAIPDIVSNLFPLGYCQSLTS